MAATTANEVVDLNNQIYEQFLNESEIAVVAFYLPWLPNYQRFCREFTKAVELMNDPRIRYGRVDSTAEADLFQRYEGVPAWPAINLFKTPAEIMSLERVYRGNLTAKGISSWIKRQVSPSFTILDADSLESFKKASEITVVGYTAQDDELSNQTFHAVAESLRDELLFGIVHAEDVAEQEQIKTPGIVLYKDFDEGKNTLNEVADTDAIIKFIRESATPLVMDLLPETIGNLKSQHTVLGYLFANASELVELKDYVARPLATKYRGKIQLGIADININSGLANDAHVNVNDLPCFAIADTVKHRHYPLKDRPVSKDAVEIFIQSFLNGELRPEVRSAPIPRLRSPVIEVVADTWHELVINNDKDVLIEYYTSWCGPCKALLPNLKKLAEMYAADPASRDKVVIGMIDGEANDLDSDVRGFPTIKLFPSGSKDCPIVFMEAHAIHQWARFIQDRGGHKIRLDLIDG